MIEAILAQAGGGGGDESAVSLLSFVQAGGVIGYVIIGLSLVALGLAVAHALSIRRNVMAPPELMDELEELLIEQQPPDIAGAREVIDDEPGRSFVSRVLGAGLKRLDESSLGALELKGALEEAAGKEVARMYRATDGLALIAAIAPMLGLLGTVVGINAAFRTISTSDGFARQTALAGDISLALTTTIMGLVLAIPATAAVTYFRNRIDGLAQEVGDDIERLAGAVERSAEV